MSTGQEREGAQPRTSVRRSYERCLATRQQWRSVRAKTVSRTVRDEAHGDLHEAVMAWFETLVPYISGRPGEVKQLWENAPLYPLEPKGVDGLACQNDACGFLMDFDDATDEDGELQYDVGGECPYCGDEIVATELLRTTEDGQVLYEWACGLKRLASWSSATETVVVESDEWDTGQDTVEVPRRLDPDVLLRAARYLDVAAEECGLLEDTDRALPTGEL